jgi:hypothetical protein
MADPELADAVWTGTASHDDAPAWYPRVARIVDAARHRQPPGDADVDRARAAWNELSRRAHARQRRRRLLVAGAVAVGAALAAGGAAAALDGGLDRVPFLGSAPAVGDVDDVRRSQDADDGDPGGPARDLMLRRAVAPRSRPASRPGSPAGSPDVLVSESRSVPPACEREVEASPGCSDRGRHTGGGAADASVRSSGEDRAATAGAGQPSGHPAVPSHAGEVRDAPPAARGSVAVGPDHARRSR